MRKRILETASAIFYRRGVLAVGVDLVVEEGGVAKTSLYRHFRTKDDLIAAFLHREDEDFWKYWDNTTQSHRSNPEAELEAQLKWIGVRVNARTIAGARSSMSPLSFLIWTIPSARLPLRTRDSYCDGSETLPNVRAQSAPR